MVTLNGKRAHFLAILILLVAAVQGVFAQDGRAALTVRIDQIISTDFPNMTVYTVVENERGEVVSGLAPGLFRFRINSFEEKGRTVIAPFSLKGLPVDYSIVISNSGIMEGSPLDFQKNAVLQFVESMRDIDRLSLYTIGEEAGIVFEELRKDSIDPAVINAIGVTAAQPRLNDSIINVMRRVQRRQIERRVVIVISDGRDQNSRFSKVQLEAVLEEVGVPIYALGIRVLGAQTLSNLNEMANATGGAYIYASQLSDMPLSLRSLNSRIAQPYMINIRVRSLKANNLPNIFEVSVDERDSYGRGQRAFVATIVPIPQWLRIALLIAIAVVIAIAIVLTIIRRIVKRKRMGITRRRCPDCRNRMKDEWDSCPFCRFMPNLKKPKKKKKAKTGDA